MTQAANRGERLDVRGKDLLLDCYCETLSFSQAASATINADSECHNHWLDKAPLYVNTFFASIIIAGVNILLEVLSRFFSLHEKHHCVVNMELSTSKRIFA